MKMAQKYLTLTLMAIVSLLYGQERGVALVIGNQNYEVEELKLTKAINDAEDVGKKLEEMGWKVKVKKDVKRKELLKELNGFKEELMKVGGIGIFYYSGHGVENRGISYLIPIEGRIESEEDVEAEGIKVETVVERMSKAGNGRNVVIFDMCRSTELRTKGVSGGGGEPVAQAGTVIGYASARGQVAHEGSKSERNSVFTKYLLKHLDKKGIAITEMLREVKREVVRATSNQKEAQRPHTDEDLTEQFSLVEEEGGAGEKNKGQEENKALARMYIKKAKGLLESGEIEELKKGVKLLEKALEAEKGNKEAEKWKKVLEKAIKEIEEIEERRPRGWGETLWGVCWKGSYVDFTEGEWEKLGSVEQSRLGGEYQKWYAKRDNGGEYEKEFREGGTEIEMVLIPPGKYWRGSPKNELDRSSDEERHKVWISKGYWCGKYEVTQGQWKAVMGSEPWKGSSSTPAAPISWKGCKSFCDKLGMKLLSEAQWEYACRGGTTTPFSFGENINTGQVNYDGRYPYKNGEKGVYRQKMMEVGSFPANGWGLYEMHGNVSEWCEDWYAEYPSGEVKDPVHTTIPSYRVKSYRGGSKDDHGTNCRSSERNNCPLEAIEGHIGFRVSRSLGGDATSNLENEEASSNLGRTVQEGFPAIHLDSFDTEDPVQVGDQTTYVVKVRNEGKKQATQVQLTFNCPEESTYVSHTAKRSGLKGEASGNVVTFETIPVLEPGDSVVYEVTVKALREASSSSTIGVKCAEFAKPFIILEPTIFYK
jgi:sulfatase modifying factor 1